MMLRATWLAVTVFLLPLGHAVADAPPNLGANAALKYWQAFATLPQFNDAEQKKLVEYQTGTLDAHARELVAKANYSLLMLHHGAALPNCDWGIGAEEGVYVRFVHAPAARVLTNIACIRARMRIEEGKNSDAIDDLLAVWLLGRRIPLPGTNILLLMGYAIEQRVGETLALCLPKLTAAEIRNVKARRDALPAGMNSTMVLGTEEKFFLDWFIRQVKESKDKESLLAKLEFVNVEPEGKRAAPGNKARTFIEDCGGTLEGVMKFAEQTRSSYAHMMTKMALPIDEFDKELEREKTKQAGNPVFNVFFPALANVRRAEARLQIRRELLSAAIAVQLEGRDALKNHPDPVAGGAFEYVAFDGGYELRSKYKDRDDKPIVLIVGRRGN
jgi:hypothetical protein